MLILPLAARYAGTRLRQLLRRTRWLLLSIALLFAFVTPGQPLAEPWGRLGLTKEGMEFALLHSLRLILLLGLLAILLERLGIPALISGLYTLLAPLGKNQRRSQMALRLLLVLEYVEQGRALRAGGKAPGWRYWLAPNDLPDHTSTLQQDYPEVTLDLAPLTLPDYTFLLLSLLTLGGLSIAFYNA